MKLLKLKLETRKAADIVTLEEEVPVNEQSDTNNKRVTEVDVLDEKTKEQIELLRKRMSLLPQ